MGLLKVDRKSKGSKMVGGKVIRRAVSSMKGDCKGDQVAQVDAIQQNIATKLRLGIGLKDLYPL